jgi:transposase
MRPTGTAQQLEQRRRTAMTLLDQGHRPAEVARQLGVTRGAIAQWQKAFQRDGPTGLSAKPHPGRGCSLTDRQRQKLPSLLLKGATAQGYPNELWTLPRVAAVIQKQFGVSYDPSSVWHILHDLGWSCQKPERRARERNEPAIAQWRKHHWPRIKKRHTKRA